MELSGPDFCAVGGNVEFVMVNDRRCNNLSFRAIDPSGNEFVPIVENGDDPTVCLVSFATSAIGMYKINVYENNLLQNKPVRYPDVFLVHLQLRRRQFCYRVF